MMSARQYRVLFIHGSDDAYGADRILIQTVASLVARGHTARVLLPDDCPPGWVSTRLSELRVEHFRVSMAVARRRHLRFTKIALYPLALLRSRAVIRREIATWRPNIVHVNTSAVLVASLLGRPADTRLVWHIHEIAVGQGPLALVMRIAPAVSADRVVAVSDAVARHLIAGPLRRRVDIVHNGLPDVDPPEVVLDRGQAPIAAFIGRLNRWKGAELFVSAAAIVAASSPAATFVIAGSPPVGEERRRDQLEALVRELGLAARVSLVGFIPHGATMAREVDVVVVPSTSPDPFPTVILEAMRAGKPVVAARHGGAPEMIEDGVSGLLFQPRDVRALADAITRLLESPITRSKMGARARERFRAEFTVDRYLDGLEDVYARASE